MLIHVRSEVSPHSAIFKWLGENCSDVPGDLLRSHSYRKHRCSTMDEKHPKPWFCLRDLGWIWNLMCTGCRINPESTCNEKRIKIVTVMSLFRAVLVSRFGTGVSTLCCDLPLTIDRNAIWCIQDVNYIYIKFFRLKSLMKSIIWQPRFDFSCI